MRACCFAARHATSRVSCARPCARSAPTASSSRRILAEVERIRERFQYGYLPDTVEQLAARDARLLLARRAQRVRDDVPAHDASGAAYDGRHRQATLAGHAARGSARLRGRCRHRQHGRDGAVRRRRRAADDHPRRGRGARRGAQGPVLSELCPHGEAARGHEDAAFLRRRELGQGHADRPRKAGASSLEPTRAAFSSGPSALSSTTPCPPHRR